MTNLEQIKALSLGTTILTNEIIDLREEILKEKTRVKELLEEIIELRRNKS